MLNKKYLISVVVLIIFLLSFSCGESTNNNGNTPPKVSVIAEPNIGKTPLTVKFTVTATDNGRVISYEWDFEGDNKYDGNTSINTMTYTYNFVGVYKTKVKVTDNEGLSTEFTVAVNVTAD